MKTSRFSVIGLIASVLVLLALTSGHTFATSKIKAVHSGKCLEVYDASQENGGNVNQWDGHGGTIQEWELVPDGLNYF